jgi:hypothetical protein
MKFIEEHNAVFITKSDIEDLYESNIIDSKTIVIRLWIASIFVGIFVILVFWLSYRIINPLIGVAGVVSPNGEVTLLSPKVRLDVTGEAAYKFATEAAIDLNTYFFIDYRETLKSHRRFFTPTAYEMYLKGTFDSGLFEDVLTNLLNVTASISNKNFINAADYFYRGNHVWVVRISLHLRTENKSGIDILSTKTMIFSMQEVDRDISKYGLLITNISEN